MQPFEQVVGEHGPVVMRVCLAMLPRADADDAWSDTFLAALRSYPDLPPGSNVRGWLVTIAHNKAIDLIRGGSRRPSPMERLPESASHDLAPIDQRDDELRESLAALPPKQRTAVTLRYVADLPYAEIASMLECSQAAARRSAADGIAKLRAHYRKETA